VSKRNVLVVEEMDESVPDSDVKKKGEKKNSKLKINLSGYVTYQDDKKLKKPPPPKKDWKRSKIQNSSFIAQFS